MACDLTLTDLILQYQRPPGPQKSGGCKKSILMPMVLDRDVEQSHMVMFERHYLLFECQIK